MSYEFHIHRSNRDGLLDSIDSIREEIPGVAVNGSSSLLIEELPDVFVAASENVDSSVSVYFAYGGSISELEIAFQFSAVLASRLQGSIFDPQLERAIDQSTYDSVLDKWMKTNESVLRSYADGHHYLRQVIESNNERVMLEAQRFEQMTAQNWASVAVGFSRSGDFDNAMSCFKGARKISPDDPEILYSMGLTCALAGKRSEAVRYLKQAIKVDSTHKPSTELFQDLVGK